MTFRSGTDFGNSTLVATSDPFYIVANASESSSVVASLRLSTATSSPLNAATSSPSYTATTSPSNAASPPRNTPSGHLSAGTKAGIAVAVVVLLIVSTGIVFWFLTKHRSRRKAVPLVRTTGPEKGILQGLFSKPELDGTCVRGTTGQQHRVEELDDTDIKGNRPLQSQIFELDAAAAESTKGNPNTGMPGPQGQR